MKVTVCGDFVPREEVAEIIERGQGAALFSEAKPVLDDADYNIVNYESAINAPGDTPIVKDGMHLGSTPAAVRTLRELGFHCVTLANNHSLDYGPQALLRTMDECRRNGLDTVGAGIDRADAARPLVKEIGGRRLAVVNCCEREYTIAGRTTPGANPVDAVDIYAAIQQARAGADHVLVIVHGGAEMMPLPSPRMQKLYRFFIDAGADAVVNHHQHCLSGWETYKGRPIVYGLGNFCFRSREDTDPAWTTGYMACLDFSADGVAFTPVFYRQGLGDKAFALAPAEELRQEVDALNSVIADPSLLEERYEQWMNQTEDAYIAKFQPLRGWAQSARLRLLARLRLAPAIDFTPSFRFMLNCVRCESHRERTIAAMTRKLAGK